MLEKREIELLQYMMRSFARSVKMRDMKVLVVLKDGVEKLYFAIETKCSTSGFDLRGREDQEIKYGRKHFEALGGAEFELVKDRREFKRILAEVEVSK